MDSSTLLHLVESTPPRVPTPDRAIADRHLTILDEDAEFFTLATFTDGKAKPKPDPLARILHGPLDDHWETLCDLQRNGAGVFVVVNATDRKGAKNENIVHVRALWQEADRGDEPALPIEPHIIVESSPGKHHRYVLVDGAPLDEFEPVQQRLVDSYGSDPNAKDRRRVLRLAGFYHLKDPAKPHLVRIVAESGAAPLDWQTAKRVFPPVERKESSAPNSDALPAPGTPLAKPAEIASTLVALDPDIGYADWLKIGMALHSTGAGLEAFHLWDGWSSTGSGYRPGECAYRWGTFKRTGGTTLGTLFRMAHLPGWNGEIGTRPDIVAMVDVQRRRMLEEFGKRHAVAMVQGKAIVVYREYDHGSKSMTTRYCSRGDIALKYETDRLPFTENKGGAISIVRKPLVPIWIQSPTRRTFEQIVFKPRPWLVAGPTGLPDSGILNLYQGLAVHPREGDVSLILDHILQVWCSGDDLAYQYVTKWLARMFQRPGERGHTVIVLRSGEGTGKDIIIDMLVTALGEHACVATRSEDLTGRFNDHLATSVLVFANEAIWGGDKSQEGALKSLITDQDLPVERKYLPKFRVGNCCHLMMASNNDWVAPVGLDDRRFVILDVSNERQGDFAYFRRLRDQIANGGTAAFVHYLLTLDISDFEVRELPDLGLNQATKSAAKILGADSVTQWVFECLHNGEMPGLRQQEVGSFGSERVIQVPVDLASGWDDGPVTISRSELQSAYVEWCTKHRKRASDPAVIGAKLRALTGATDSRPREGAQRQRAYVLPWVAEIYQTWCLHKSLRQGRRWDRRSRRGHAVPSGGGRCAGHAGARPRRRRPESTIGGDRPARPGEPAARLYTAS